MERLASGKRRGLEAVGKDDCDLCKMFNKFAHGSPDTRCFGCPVFEKTGSRFCYCTPFEEAQDIADRIYEFEEPLDTAIFKEAAQKELEFLKSLIPKDHK